MLENDKFGASRVLGRSCERKGALNRALVRVTASKQRLEESEGGCELYDHLEKVLWAETAQSPRRDQV